MRTTYQACGDLGRMRRMPAPARLMVHVAAACALSANGQHVTRRV